MSTTAKKLVYTRDSALLTFDQRCFYEANGYLVIPQLVPLNILTKCSQRFDDIVDGIVERGNIIVMRDVTDRKAVNKVQDINHDEVFCEYIEYKPMVDVVEAITGPNIMAMHSMLIAKPPDSGSNSSKHPPHQDLYYFPFRPVDRIVASWTAIEPCDTMNGCLFVSPGSHSAQKLYPHDYPTGGANNKFYHGIQNLPDMMKWQHLEMQPGDTVFFHPLLVHGSGANKSNRTRRAISCHYAAAECNYIDVSGTVQDAIAKEVVEVKRKRYAADGMEFEDFFRLKSSLVRGMRSNL